MKLQDTNIDSLDFETWVNTGDKVDYYHLISRDVAPLLIDLVEEWFEESQIIELSAILEFIEDMGYKDLDSDYLFELKQELIDLNFGSMIYIW